MVEGWMELGNQIALSFSAECMQVDSFGRQCLSNTLLNPLTITHSEEIKTHSYTVTPILTDSFRGIRTNTWIKFTQNTLKQMIHSCNSLNSIKILRYRLNHIQSQFHIHCETIVKTLKLFSLDIWHVLFAEQHFTMQRLYL